MSRDYLSRSYHQPTRAGKTARLLAAVLAVAACGAAARGLAPAGRYQILVTQEIPNVAKAADAINVEACLTKRVIESAAAFHVRGESPLRGCPISELNFNGEELTYRLLCGQPDAPSARAKFVYTPIGYEGAIVMRIGNMTMTERHRAQRIGECPNDDSASILRMHEDFRMPPEPQPQRVQ